MFIENNSLSGFSSKMLILFRFSFKKHWKITSRMVFSWNIQKWFRYFFGFTLSSDFGFRDIHMPNDPSSVVLSKNIQKSLFLKECQLSENEFRAQITFFRSRLRVFISQSCHQVNQFVWIPQSCHEEQETRAHGRAAIVRIWIDRPVGTRPSAGKLLTFTRWRCAQYHICSSNFYILQLK